MIGTGVASAWLALVLAQSLAVAVGDLAPGANWRNDRR
jgi:hypothetical protein